MFKLLHQCNNIVETTQLTNDQMPEFHCQCECSKCPPPAPSSNRSLQSLTLISLSQPCRSVLVPDNLKRFFDFDDSFRLCFKLGVSVQHCIPYSIVHWVYIRQIWRQLGFLTKSGQLARSPFRALRAVCWRAVLLEDEPGEKPAIALKR